MKRFPLLYIVLAFVGSAIQNGTVHAQRLHAFLVVDSDDSKIGESVATDGRNVFSMLDNGLPDEKCVVYILASRQVTSKNIIRTIRNAQIDSTDSVLFYYSGHGSFDGVTGNHQFTLDHSDRLSRRDVKNELQRHHPKLAVVLSDCCAGIVNSPTPTRSADPSSRLKTRQEMSKALEDLFFNTSGVVDITSSRPGQVSVGLDSSGGLFTTAIVDAIEANANSRMDWKTLFSEARLRTSKAYESVHKLRKALSQKGIGDHQETQTAWSFGTMSGVNPNNQRLGAYLDLNHSGIVVKVNHGSVAQRYGLEQGDKILSVNGQSIHSTREAIDLIGDSSLNMSLVVRCVRTGNHYKIPLKLPY